MLLVVLEIMTFALDAVETGCKCHDRTTRPAALSGGRRAAERQEQVGIRRMGIGRKDMK